MLQIYRILNQEKIVSEQNIMMVLVKVKPLLEFITGWKDFLKNMPSEDVLPCFENIYKKAFKL